MKRRWWFLGLIVLVLVLAVFRLWMLYFWESESDNFQKTLAWINLGGWGMWLVSELYVWKRNKSFKIR